MQYTFDITDEKQLEQVETLRGDRSADEFIAVCFEQGLKLAEFQQRQMGAAREAAKHPLLQFPEARQEFKNVEDAAIMAAAKGKNPSDPIAIEVTRLATAYIAQVDGYARQHGNKLPAFLPVDGPTVPVEKVSFQIAAAVIKARLEKNEKSAAA